jgi:Fe2+ or Zn2+ uptake regulation protein
MNKRDEISKKILDYLRKNSDAGDTLEGITGWWLESERVDYAVDEVAEVLEVLLENGLLTKSKYENGNVVYKLTNSKGSNKQNAC